MILGGDIVSSAHGCRGRRPGFGWSRPGRLRLAAAGLICVGAAMLAGCSLSGGMDSLIVDPGRYSAYHCKQMAERLTELVEQQKDLRNLMDKASDGGGGSVIGTLSYRATYEKAVGDEAVLRRTAAEKKCPLPPPTPPPSATPAAFTAPAASPAPAFQSDQIIR